MKNQSLRLFAVSAVTIWLVLGYAFLWTRIFISFFQKQMGTTYLVGGGPAEFWSVSVPFCSAAIFGLGAFLVTAFVLLRRRQFALACICFSNFLLFAFADVLLIGFIGLTAFD